MKQNKTILLTGGCGYIGSHTCVELINEGYDVIVYDNLSNSSEKALERVKDITGVKPLFIKGDVLDKDLLDKVFSEHKIDAVINFAGLKAVGESVEKPLEYYHNNITGAINVLEVMRAHNVFSFIFSSSATVYGNPKSLPIKEDFPTGGTTNPYGTTKLFIEQILKDLYASDNRFNITILRYFNPIGAHESGLIGEDPNGIPNNLMPYISQVAIGKREYLRVFGNDYNTKDGTGVRDYIHVVDLAHGHLLALNHMLGKHELSIYNLGTGTGYSVFDVLHAMEKACGFEIPYKVMERRSGDIDACYCDPEKAKKELGFKAKYSIEEMARDSWNWQKRNPNGYKS
ncbi:MAG: UDP-glucose 4-epimerase GalE [Gammaproteobacteria bacterium]|nr:UDP-glucose 4-epimerase GalE [Gammaproteobacteria bacterium]